MTDGAVDSVWRVCLLFYSCHAALASKSVHRKGRSSNRKTRSQTSLGTDTDDTEAASLQQIEKERKQLELENEERKKQLEMLKEEERSTQAALSTGGSCLNYVAGWHTTSTQTIAHNIYFIKNMLNIHIYDKILDVVLVLLMPYLTGHSVPWWRLDCSEIVAGASDVW